MLAVCRMNVRPRADAAHARVVGTCSICGSAAVAAAASTITGCPGAVTVLYTHAAPHPNASTQERRQTLLAAGASSAAG